MTDLEHVDESSTNDRQTGRAPARCRPPRRGDPPHRRLVKGRPPELEPPTATPSTQTKSQQTWLSGDEASPSPPPLVAAQPSPTTAARTGTDGRQTRVRPTTWALLIVALAELVIVGIVAVGGDPVYGAASAAILLGCGCCLIMAEQLRARRPL